MSLLWKAIIVLFILLIVNGAFTPDKDHLPKPSRTTQECAVHC